jgi:hypothetical protein
MVEDRMVGESFPQRTTWAGVWMVTAGGEKLSAVVGDHNPPGDFWTMAIDRALPRCFGIASCDDAAC